jgi:hypothetical protein
MKMQRMGEGRVLAYGMTDPYLDYQDLPSGSFKGWGKWLTVKIIELNR